MKFNLALIVIFLLVAGGCTAQAAEEGGLSVKVVAKPVRALHFVLKSLEIKRAFRLVDLAERAGFNTIVVQLAWGVKLEAAPWVASRRAWTRDEFLAWFKYAEMKGMLVIPEIKLLTHQKMLFQDSYPELMFNADTYDPRNKGVYNKVFLLLDEVIKLIHPSAIHIGHDEVAGHSIKSAKRWLRNGEKVLPANLFLQDTLRVYDYLKKHGIETWMWGDMLISPTEFKGMRYQQLHGREKEGYGKPLRDQLPKDIVIVDWHYADKQSVFPSLATMQQEGFRVVGSTWRKEETVRNFSRYASKHEAYGMMATTWFYVPRKKENIVNRIIEFSGQAFLKDFPDAK